MFQVWSGVLFEIPGVQKTDENEILQTVRIGRACSKTVRRAICLSRTSRLVVARWVITQTRVYECAIFRHIRIVCLVRKPQGYSHVADGQFRNWTRRVEWKSHFLFRFLFEKINLAIIMATTATTTTTTTRMHNECASGQWKDVRCNRIRSKRQTVYLLYTRVAVLFTATAVESELLSKPKTLFFSGKQIKQLSIYLIFFFELSLTH